MSIVFTCVKDLTQRVHVSEHAHDVFTAKIMLVCKVYVNKILLEQRGLGKTSNPASIFSFLGNTNWAYFKSIEKAKVKRREKVDCKHQIGKRKVANSIFMRTSLKNHSDSISGKLLITPIYATLSQIHLKVTLPGHLPLRAQHIPRTGQALPDEASCFLFLVAMSRTAMSWATEKKNQKY